MGAFEGEYMSDRDHLTYSREVMTRKYAETYRKKEELKLPKRCGAIGDAHSATTSVLNGWLWRMDYDG